MISSRSAGIGAECHAAAPLCIAHRQSRRALPCRRRSAYRVVQATTDGAAASGASSASALSTRFEDFILRTQDEIIKVTAFCLERSFCALANRPIGNSPQSQYPPFHTKLGLRPVSSRAPRRRSRKSWTAAGRRSCVTAGSGRAPSRAQGTASRACWRAVTCSKRFTLSRQPSASRHVERPFPNRGLVC